MDKSEAIRMTAAMDQMRTHVEHIGKKRKASDMELVFLCNLAEIGMYYIFTNVRDETGKMAAKELEKHVEAIRNYFSDENEQDGLSSFMAGAASILRGEKFQRYLIRKKD